MRILTGALILIGFVLFTQELIAKTKVKPMPLTIISNKGFWSNCYVGKYEQQGDKMTIYVMGDRCFIKRGGKPSHLPKWPKSLKAEL